MYIDSNLSFGDLPQVIIVKIKVKVIIIIKFPQVMVGKVEMLEEIKVC